MTNDKSNNPTEIPNRENPDKTYPNKAPGTAPGQDNPTNPQEDL